jgi:hypothetical protein
MAKKKAKVREQLIGITLTKVDGEAPSVSIGLNPQLPQGVEGPEFEALFQAAKAFGKVLIDARVI